MYYGQPDLTTSYTQTNCRAEQLKAIINCSSLWTARATTPDIQTMYYGQPDLTTSYTQTNCRAEQLKAIINCSSLWTAGATTPDIQTKSLIQWKRQLYTVTHCGQSEPPSSYIQTKCGAEQLKAVLNCKTEWTAGATKSVMQTMSHAGTAGATYILRTNQLPC